MRILACLVPLVALAAAPLPKPGARCPADRVVPVNGGKTPLIHSLRDEPGARLEIAVQRFDGNGCVTPIVVRENIGGTSPPVYPGGARSAQTSSTSRP